MAGVGAVQSPGVCLRAEQHKEEGGGGGDGGEAPAAKTDPNVGDNAPDAGQGQGRHCHTLRKSSLYANKIKCNC